MAEQKQMKLGALLLAEGGSASGWRHPDAGTEGGAKFGRFKEWTRQAEAGKLDLVFIADVLYITGKSFSAKNADAIFTTQRTMEDGIAFKKEIAERAAAQTVPAIRSSYLMELDQSSDGRRKRQSANTSSWLNCWTLTRRWNTWDCISSIMILHNMRWTNRFRKLAIWAMTASRSTRSKSSRMPETTARHCGRLLCR
ncbi:hypothetical protein M3650_13360 [Paenibacillus sp. MER TA 81-3]|uniref:hypothetical protein n=1 Tax=Paenibacillus sp. MER TA 81-3 TaxID=2939573 RepID=UPI00203DF9C6|nr:hypothetical protein [Paenibacillus sp. MER TA 81-3]MCM3339583.1 hypothetical protein [Paenibacillus sp. MER TA 81-3]